MKKSTLILRVILLTFVVTAIGYMFLRDRTSSSSRPAASTTATAPERSGFVAYYFHNTRRCPTCRTIEAQALEAINHRFAEELRQGKLKWAAVNLEDLGNDHYATDYGVTGSSLIMAELKGGRPVRFTKLEKTWNLLHDKPAFQDYVAAEVSAFLQAKR